MELLVIDLGCSNSAPGASCKAGGRLLTLSACARVTVVILCVCVCLSVTTLSLTATYLVCESKFRCLRFLMAFQTHDLCEFRRERLILASFADSKLLDFSDPMSVWSSIQHIYQGCYCCEPLNLEQHYCALASSPILVVSPRWPTAL